MIKTAALNDLNLCNSIIDAYIKGNENIASLYDFAPNMKGLREACKAKSKQKYNRVLLAQKIKSQFIAINDESFDTSKIIANIASLAQKNTFTVTTGQQLHLFLGPGYFINKIYSCIKLAQHFNSTYSDTKVIPVFWLASEDHDTEEISNIDLFNQKYSASLPADMATGKISTKNIAILTRELELRLGKEKNNGFFQLCKTAYSKFETISEATRYIIYSLFHAHGILVLDADDADLKKSFSAIAREEIAQETTFLLQKKVINQFTSNNWHYQVMPRGTNLFLINEEGKRTIADAGIYDENTNYSPNALLRPLYQEILLPNIAYVGGAAEVNYWLQLKPIFEHYKIIMPVIWLRDTLQLTGIKTFAKVKSLKELANWDEQEFENAYVARYSSSALLKQIIDLENNIAKAAKLNSTRTLETLLEKTKELSIFLKKTDRAAKKELLTQNNYLAQLLQIKKIKNLLVEKNNLQERTKSTLELDLNFNLSIALTELYLDTNLTHGHYYLVGMEIGT